jgi:uncharacterized protein YjbJ (UPF0337 family)
MNWDQVQGKWHQLTGKAKSAWGKLTDDDIKNIAGKKEVLIGKIQARYGVVKEQAEHQVDDWVEKLDLPASAPVRSAGKDK